MHSCLAGWIVHEGEDIAPLNYYIAKKDIAFNSWYAIKSRLSFTSDSRLFDRSYQFALIVLSPRLSTISSSARLMQSCY